jgi:DNA-binding transcriptional LysR family regulator
MTGLLVTSRPKYPKIWRLSHLGAKLAFLRAGLGFGSMPLHTIEAELVSGALIEITPLPRASPAHLCSVTKQTKQERASAWLINTIPRH